MIVHTAVRSKVPLKKKVRGERKKKSSSKAPALPQKENILANSLANAATSPTLPLSILPALKFPSSKRQSAKAQTDSPRKLLKKKKKQRPSSEESTPKKEVEQPAPVKPTRKPKKKSKHKEVIDYSNSESHSNTFGKVQKWLLESPIVSSAASQIEHASKISNIMSKSQSTPENLTVMQRSAANAKGKSANNLNDKVRLQVVYKPPFKFSLKFSKNDPSVKTKVLGIDKNPRSKGRVDRQRNSMEDPIRSRRTALLIRSATEEISNKLMNDFTDEPMYETLNPKINPPHHQRQKSLTMPLDSMPNYENIPTSSTANLIDLSLTNSTTSPVINTATFRVNKSASGGNITNRYMPVVATPVLSKSRRTASQKGSQQNLINNSGSGGRERRSSIGNSTNLIKFGGSSQNLTRSSTTNLTKNRQDGIIRRASDMNRSSTTNLNKYHRQNSSQGSNTNLRRGGSSMDVNAGEEHHGVSSNERKAHSRKNSVKESMGSKSNLPRTHSNSNLMSGGAMPGPSRRESFNNNIPRASLANTTSSNQFNRQISLNVKPTLLSQQSRMLIEEVNKNRPQTSSCDSSMFKNFEWPKVLTTQRSLPVNDAQQSDMEVMVSDAETLGNDR